MTSRIGILPAPILEAYQSISTASICTILFKKGLRNVYVQGVSRVNGSKGKLVGQAYTLRYIPAREDLDKIDVFADPKHPQRDAVETIPEQQVLVMDCHRDASAASAGSILAKRLEMRGCAGLVTDGGLRDVDEIAASDLPAFCAKPSAPTNLTKHHAIEQNVPVGCGGVPVFPGDLIVGDGDGVVVVPLAYAEDIAGQAQEMERFEAFVFKRVAKGESIIGLYPPNEAAWAEFLKHKQEN